MSEPMTAARAFSLRSAIAACAFVLAMLTGTATHAVYQCGNQKDTCTCGKNNPFPCCDNGGNCTWWAWEGACCSWGAPPLPTYGNANDWLNEAQAAGWPTGTTPLVGSVFVRTVGQYGHVGFITSVDASGGFCATEMSCWGQYGKYNACHKAGYAQGFICKKGTNCGNCECSAGQSQSKGCGRCGTQTRGCDGCHWGGWSGCNGEGVCSPGEQSSGGCGNCGTHQRTCTGSCFWGDFGECTGQGECGSGTTSTLACGECGYKERTCSAQCAWGEFGKCVWLDPQGGTQACDTTLAGQCAPGFLKCLSGTVACVGSFTSQPEVCDGLDNDCDGVSDEDLPAMGTTPPPWGAELVASQLPAQVITGQSLPASMTWRNVGSETWQPGTVVLRAKGQVDGQASWLRHDSWPGLSTAAILKSPVAPGASVTFDFMLRGPPLADACSTCLTDSTISVPIMETFTLLHQGEGRFACPKPWQDVTVTVTPAVEAKPTDPTEIEGPGDLVLEPPDASTTPPDGADVGPAEPADAGAAAASVPHADAGTPTDLGPGPGTGTRSCAPGTRGGPTGVAGALLLATVGLLHLRRSARRPQRSPPG